MREEEINQSEAWKAKLMMHDLTGFVGGSK